MDMHPELDSLIPLISLQANGESEPKRHVICVDNSLTFLRILRVLLETNGYKVTTIRYGADTFFQIAIRRPDLVVVDLPLRESRGWTLLNDLLEVWRTRWFPVIVVSTERNALARIRRETDAYRHVGACFHKPLDLDQLVEAIDRLTRRFRDVGGL
jgi:DNA-binding response OmpR family regulator